MNLKLPIFKLFALVFGSLFWRGQNFEQYELRKPYFDKKLHIICCRNDYIAYFFTQKKCNESDDGQIPVKNFSDAYVFIASCGPTNETTANETLRNVLYFVHQPVLGKFGHHSFSCKCILEMPSSWLGKKYIRKNPIESSLSEKELSANF